MFLLKHLKQFKISDPFIVRKSDEVVLFFKEKPDLGYAFSIDVEDLFYSVPQHELLASVKECIAENNEVAFQNTAGIRTSNFITLLEAYLHSTFVSYDEKLFLLRKGICIGSCVMPILCEIFLSQVDHTLDHAFIEGGKVLHVFRFVDDFLVLLKPQAEGLYGHQVEVILDLFNRHGKGLTFTHELPTQNCLQFLDINLVFLTNMCAGLIDLGLGRVSYLMTPLTLR